jgi:hypothetical protein
MTSQTLEPNSIPIPPHLAGLLKRSLGRSGTGFDEAAFLQQLHYWTLNSKTTGYVVEGVKWIYNSLKAWLSQFRWMSEYGLRKAIANLKKLGLIQTAQHWVTQYKRVMFYRIDYERLNAFMGETCDLITPPDVNRDRLDVSPDHTSITEITSDTSLIRQQTDGVVLMNEEIHSEDTQATEGLASIAQEERAIARGEENMPPSSGDISNNQSANFPELVKEVAAALHKESGETLPGNLKKAIQQFPDRVKGAIEYLKHQQSKRAIANTVGYLYQAIVSGWDLSLPESPMPVVPIGFKEWFDQAQAQGRVIAATTIDGVHHTLHIHKGWVPTSELMAEEGRSVEL